jgi:ADP-ribose pyrophosphatase
MSHARERYDEIRSKWPRLFDNPPNAPYEIVFEPEQVSAAEAENGANLAARGLPAAWGETGVVFEDPYTIFVRDAVRTPDGDLGTYGRTLAPNGGGGSVVLPLLDGKIVLLRIFRHATRSWHREIPRGFAEPGVSPVDQAKQELREEIQAEAETMIELGSFHPNTGSVGTMVELFFAQIRDYGLPETAEGITGIELESPRGVAELIRDGQITDAFTIGAFTRAWMRGLLPGMPAL